MKLLELLNSLAQYENQIGGIENFLHDANGEVLDVEIKKIVNDHSKAVPGSVFVAIDGTKTDAHKYIEDARSSGAEFVIGTRYSESEDIDPDLVVRNARAVVGPATSAILDYPSSNLNIFGITGTNGKTTTTYLISYILKNLKKSTCVIGATGIYVGETKKETSHTTPDSIFLQKLFAELVRDKIENVVMEVSSHALDQHRVLGTKFTSVGFSNLTQDHLDYHETFESYFEAKALLFNGQYSSKGTINIDDEYGVRLVRIAKNNNMEVLTCSIKDESANIFIKELSSSLDSTKLEITYRNGETVQSETVEISLLGDFNQENIAMAIGMLIHGGYSFLDVLHALSGSINVPGRLERVENDKKYSVFVDYSHTPDALKRACEVLRPLSKKLVVVFGCGGDRDRAKRPIMGDIASQIGDVVVITSDNPRSEDPEAIISQIQDGVKEENKSKVVAFTDRYKAIEYALSQAEENDSVLIAGKGHETYQEFKDKVIDFSDKLVAKEIIEKGNK